MPLPHDRHVAAVYGPADDFAVAAQLAERLDAALRPVSELNGCAYPDGTAVGRAALEGIADLHRGETVIVLTADDDPAREVRIDADGWSVTPLAAD